MQESRKNESKSPSKAQIKDWIGETSLIYGGLTGLGLIMTQPFIFEGELTDMAAIVCVVSFAISTPILAALFLLSHEENFKKRINTSAITAIGRTVAQLAALVGFVAGFWHISVVAGLVAIGSGILAAIIYSTGFYSLRRMS